MTALSLNLQEGKKAYFASDFHLGTPSAEASKQREKNIVSWLNSIQHDAQIIFLVGDLFDFWFEYKYTIPKGYIRLQGKLAELVDKGIEVVFFTGNHDMWMFGYFTQELGIPIYREPILLNAGSHKILLGHGDGLGPGDFTYKFIKKVFANKLCQWLFARIHPNLGFAIANGWSRHSRAANAEADEKYLGENEWLLQYCKSIESTSHHDYYVFGHRHLPLDIPVTDKSRYINLGEWFKNCSYAVYDGKDIKLHYYSA